MLDVLGALTGGNAGPYTGKRKDELVALMERLFVGDDPVVSPAAKAAAAHWLPPGMAFDTPDEPLNQDAASECSL